MKKNFYKEQAGKFISYASKFNIEPKGGLLSLFNKWADSKDFSDEDRQAIFAKFLSQLSDKNKTND